MNQQPTIMLNNGTMIPQIGIGVYQVHGDNLTQKVCEQALAMGYRHIDTAHAYQNERGVGRAVATSGLKREEIWVTSKLWPSEYGRGITTNAIDRMLERLGMDHIDLLLLHQQFGDYLGAWKDLEQAMNDRKVRSIGLSNFESERLEEVINAADIRPSVLQVECHPYYQQNKLKARIAPYDIALEAWYPLGHGDAGLLSDLVILRLAEQYGKTPAQIILRWHLQEGTIIFPRTTNPEHLRQNIDILDFSLTQDEMEAIHVLDKGQRFFTMTLAEQEAHLSQFKPAD